MFNKLYFLCLAPIVFLLTIGTANAQCTSAAGTLSAPPTIAFCEGEDVVAPPAGNAFLDADDLLRVVAYTGATPGPGTVFATSTDGNFPYQPDFLTNAPFNLAVVVANDLGGAIDWNDPCLSVSPPVIVGINPLPVVTVNGPTVLTCVNTVITVVASAQLPNVQYFWVNGANGATNVIQAPGVYCLTVTSSAGCTTSTCVAITQDVNSPVVDAGPDIDLNCSNPFQTLIPNVSGGGQLVYNWWGPSGFTSTLLNPIVSFPGTYTLIATNVINGCTATDAVIVTGNIFGPSVTNVNIVPVTCFGSNTGAITPVITGGVMPYSFLWTGPGGFVSTNQTLTGIGSGFYTLVVTDNAGCSFQSVYTVAEPAALIINTNITYDVCGGNLVQTSVAGGAPPFAYSWSSGSTWPVVSDLAPGEYYVTVTDANGCTFMDTILIQGGGAGGGCGYLEGFVRLDTIENCVNNAEPGLSGWLVEAIGQDTFYGVSDATGHFMFSVLPNSYTVRAVPPNALWTACNALGPIVVSAPNQTVQVGHLMVQKEYLCPAMEVSITTPLLRRCFSNNTYFVNYCNSGTTDAEDVFVIVHLDPFLSLVSATIPNIDLSNNFYRFDIGDVPAGGCGIFLIGVAVSCNAQLGQTHCTEAIIYPDSLCTPVDPMWSGALVQLRSQCTPGDSLRFILKNVGSGDMTESLKYVVIEDHVMLMQATGSPLGIGDSVIVAVPANGSTWRVEAIQASFAPIQTNPVLSVEGCTSTQSFSTGFVNQFSNADEDPWWDIDCTPNIGSFDPNDKQGFPTGVAAEHYIKPGTELEYLIRFQNTGTDTAFNIVIVDTLSAWLDVASLRAGASSHPYELNIYGAGILRFSFPNILLPDSNTNEAASHGFIRFNIDHKKNAPLETVIENQAAIYFDFNEPIFTNTTFHRLGENFLLTGIFTPKNPDISVQVQPNPSNGAAQIQVKGLEQNTPLRLRVYDLLGSLMLDKTGQGPVLPLSEKGWPSGVYLYQLDQDGQLLGSGKLMIK